LIFTVANLGGGLSIPVGKLVLMVAVLLSRNWTSRLWFGSLFV
jgi:hypothetical protein